MMAGGEGLGGRKPESPLDGEGGGISKNHPAYRAAWMYCRSLVEFPDGPLL